MRRTVREKRDAGVNLGVKDPGSTRIKDLGFDPTIARKRSKRTYINNRILGSVFEVFRARKLLIGQLIFAKPMMTWSSLWTFMSLAGLSASKYIVPGGRWHDTDGNLLNAHAGCVTIDKNTGKFWLFGEYKTQGQTEGGGVSVYSSDDLATWESHGLALGA